MSMLLAKLPANFAFNATYDVTGVSSYFHAS
ncbi:hypothetical protein HDE79_003185 [Rhodanobacter sp. MP1X3]|nr:hypothetical protein [Rhodanobacter sp. MP1X3]